MQLPFESFSKEIIVLREEESSPEYGNESNKRPIQKLLKFGIININKPSGPTSHQVSSYVKDILGIKKSGHAGTLDPKVTGCLPIAVGRGTRIVQALLPAGKEYLCIMHLHKDLPQEEVMRVIKDKFVGKIHQLPPIKSSIKRQWRYRDIYYLDVLEMIERDVLFRVGCQAGTYIRKLCTDIGKALNSGAHMAELIRTKAGPFNLDSSVTLQELRDAWWYFKEEGEEKFIRHCIRPVEEATAHLRKIWVRDSAVDTLCHGADLALPGVAKLHKDINKGDLVALLTLKQGLIALGTAEISSLEIQNRKKGRVAITKKVFMEPDTYRKGR